MSLLNSLLDSKTMVCVETASYQELNINARREVAVQHVILTPKCVQRELQRQEHLIFEAVDETMQKCKKLAPGFTGPTMIGLAEDQILVRMAEQITWRIPGLVSLYVGPTAVHDEERIVRMATNLIVAAELRGIAKTRLCISVSCLLSSDVLVPNRQLGPSHVGRYSGRQTIKEGRYRM
ncbi:hypothetical protein M408DRAFT_273606 [Serendipita vermifera MAFF 305830]|uniref:Uncharacterized protein n=1 Tax=Serendipita vermifera MAFF 305830 TaxID=933852 RepID=A0A0C3B2B6_SERVB|nr:hypothetical protein M408DRAFT_273606 [Serendipita vermifera MAFF 305830]